MKLSRRNVMLGLVALGLAGGLAGGGVALAATGPSPAPTAAAPAGNGHCGGSYGPMLGTNSPMSAAADYLGLSWADLQQRMRSGDSLADIATAQGKSVAGLKDAMVAAMKKNLDANTSLTAEQKADMLAEMKEHLDIMVTTSHMPGGNMGSMGGGHMGGMRR